MENFLSLARDNGFTLPDYQNSNLSVLKGIVDGRGSRTGDKAKKIFLIVDGLGYNLVRNLLVDCAANPLLTGSRLEKISTVYPSTTVSAITSFETGLTPAEHGMVGWDVYSREHGMVLTPFRNSPTISRKFSLYEAGIRTIIPDPKLIGRAAEKGKVLILTEKQINTFNFSNMRNCTCESYAVKHDMLVKLRDAVSKGKYDFIYVYHSLIDSLEHAYGPSSEAVRHGVSSLFAEMSRVLLPALGKSDYNLVITADHGQVDTRKLITINGKSEIMNYLSGPPWGDARIRYMNAAHGMDDALKKHFERKYGDEFLIIDSDSAIRSGIFGKKKISDALRYRFGTHLAIAKGNDAIDYVYPYWTPHKEHFKRGTHSGLSAGEMEVPLIVY
jgi:predicted AlkP superfamily pyrophosphatase or phosphodiesterase